MSKRILIIDDEADFVDTLTFSLESNGFEVVSAPDGQSGIEKLKSENPDLIILDLMMPGMDGYEVTKRLKADSASSNIPIIVLTATVTPDLKQRVCSIQVTDCVTKPCDLEDLVDKIKKALSKGAKEWKN